MLYGSILDCKERKMAVTKTDGVKRAPKNLINYRKEDKILKVEEVK